MFACWTFDIGDDLLSAVRDACVSCLMNQWAAIGDDFDVRRIVVGVEDARTHCGCVAFGLVTGMIFGFLC